MARAAARQAAAGFANRLKRFRLEVGMPWLAMTLQEDSFRAWCRRIAVHPTTWLGWEQRGSIPNRAVLQRCTEIVGLANSDEWVKWLIEGGEVPAEIKLPSGAPRPLGLESVQGSELPQLVDPIRILEGVLERGEKGQDMKTLVRDAINLLRSARKMGFAIAFIAALIGTAQEGQALDSGSSVLTDVQVRVLSSAALLRFLRRLLRTLHRRGSSGGPARPILSLSAARAYASIISIDDSGVRPAQPKMRARAGAGLRRSG